MMHFGMVSYQAEPDYAASLAFVDHYKQTSVIDDAGILLLEAALDSAKGVGKSVLILARLFFWGQVSSTFVLQALASKVTQSSFEEANVYEKQELFDCLGISPLAQLIGTGFDFSSLSTAWDDSDFSVNVDLVNPKPDETWTYIPPPTGFFSVIENIVLAQFFCKINNKVFRLDTQHNWWRYPVPFLQLFQNTSSPEFNVNLPSGKYVMWDTLRYYFRHINPSVFGLLKSFKIQQYARIKRALSHYLDDIDLRARPAPEECIVFIRGGDKVQLETISAPSELLLSDIEALRQRRISVRVLSDDYGLADTLVQSLGLGEGANLTASSRTGYHLQNGHSLDDVHTIINNFLVLSNAKYSLGCPSSNLVNSAHWSNRILDDSFKPRSIPCLRYLYL
jgi:hypothetical protein